MPDFTLTAGAPDTHGRSIITPRLGSQSLAALTADLQDERERAELRRALLEQFPQLPVDQLDQQIAALARDAAATPLDDGPDPRPWPVPLLPAAYHGIAGSFVRSCEPYTEADPAALLLQFLVAAGSCIGSAPHTMVGSDRHGANLFAVVVGRTSAGRKGTSWSCAQRVLAAADPSWTKHRITNGLSTGEGLIWAIRDPADPAQPAKPGMPSDPGVADKRLLVVEGEFGRQLAAMAREGNTTSAVLRQAWDANAPLRILTRTSPCQTSNPHVSLIGHITAEELHARLSKVDLANGVANRVLWVCSRRSRLLADAPALPEEIIDGIGAQLATVIGTARRRGRMQRTGAATALWRETYASLSAERHGLLGLVVSRAPAMVLRLSMLYALLDGVDAIDEPHLTAALATWDYCEGSANYLFGARMLDPFVDKIIRELRLAGAAGLTRTQISGLFSRNASSDRLDRAILAVPDVAVELAPPGPSGGRRPKRYVLRRNEGDEQTAAG